MASEPQLRDLIDTQTPASQSLLLRYHRVFDLLRLDSVVKREVLAASSLREGARLVRLADYNGVQIVLCDESSLMETGTYKDLDACMVAAVMRHAGIPRVTVSSGGNLGYALSRYGRHTGLELFFFHPKSTLFKLDRANFDWPGVKLISVDLPEPQVKDLALRFSKRFAITHVPDIRWRLAASAVRAMFILESTVMANERVDFIAQTMCAGYGPAGIYNCFSELGREGLVRRSDVPRFLGFQQRSNSPMVRAWREGEREIAPRHVTPLPGEYIEPGLYNTNPQGNYTRLFDLVRYFGGDFEDIGSDDYQRYAPLVDQLLGDVGLVLTRNQATGEVLEKTGIMSVMGVLKAADKNLVRRGERVLVLMTGGFRERKVSQEPAPAIVVDGARDLDAWVEKLGEAFGLKPPPYGRAAERMFDRRRESGS